MRKLLLLAVFCAAALAQQQSYPQLGYVRFVTTDPSGACGNPNYVTMNTTTGALLGCKASVWTAIGGGSGGAANISHSCAGTGLTTCAVDITTLGLTTFDSGLIECLAGTTNLAVTTVTAAGGPPLTTVTAGFSAHDGPIVCRVNSSGGNGGATVSIAGTANQLTASGAACTIAGGGTCTLSIPTNPTLPGNTTGTFIGGLTGNVTGNASGSAGTVTSIASHASTELSDTAGIARSSNNLSFFSATSSSQLFGVISDETGGGGVLVGSASPTIVTPTIASFANATHTHQNAAGGGTLDAAAIASGTLGVARGGSGLATLTAHLLYVGNGTTAPNSVAIGTAGQVLTSNGAGLDPTFQNSAGGSPLTTKGDLFGFSTLAARVPIGTDGQVLTADSSQALGLKWAAVSGTGTVTTTGDMTANAILTSAGSAGTVIQAANATATIDPSTGNFGTPGTITVGLGAGNAGAVEYAQGTAPTAGTNSVTVYAPTSVTSYTMRLPGAAATGFVLGTNTSGDVVQSFVASSGSGSVCLTTNCAMTTPDLGTPSALVATNATGIAAGLTAGITNAVKSATTTVNVSAATAPSTGQVLTATDSTHATWQAAAGGGGSVFTGSTATASTGITGTAAAPIISLSDQSVKSPLRFQLAVTASTPVTSLTINNKSAGARFGVVWTQPATNMAAVTLGASVTGTPCAVSQAANAMTEQWFEVSADGSTVYNVSCSSTDPLVDFSTFNVTLPAGSGFVATAANNIGIDSATSLPHIWAGADRTFVLSGPGSSFDALPILTAADTVAYYQINGGADCGDSGHALKYTVSTHLFGCQAITASAGSVALDAITAAGGANSINNGDNAQTWNWSLTTSSASAFKFTENTASTAAGTPFLLNVATLSTSTLNPFQVTAGGTANGVRVNTSGVLSKIGTGSVNADALNGTAFTGTSGHLVSFGAANIPADSGVVAANAVVASSPGAGIAHFAGSTQTVTSSAVSLTADVSGLLPLANGGTAANLTASNGGIFYSTSSAGAILAGTATARQMLQSGASTTPAWSATTWPATTTINRILYSSSTSVIGEITTANGGLLNANASGVPAMTVTPVLGLAGTSTGTIGLSGVTSGVVTIQPASAAGTWSMTMPTSGGSASQFLQTNGSGVTTWATPSGTISGLTTNAIVAAASSSTIATPSTTSTIDSSGNMVLAGTLTTSGGTVTWGTAGGFISPEGTAPTVGFPASGLDGCYADSTQHGYLCSYDNGSLLPLALGPASTTSGHVVSWNSTTGALMADGGAVAANLVVASSPGAGIAHFAGSTQTVTSSALALADMATQAAGTVVANATGSTAAPTATRTLTLGLAGTAAGTIAYSGATAGTFTIGATPNTTASNTLLGPAAVITTGHIVDCTTSSTTCTLHDSGVVTANVVNASSPGAGVAHFAGSTQTVTSSAVALTDLATQAADSMLLNATAGSAAPTAVAMPTSGTNGCAGASNALTYNTTTHALGCNSISAGGAALSSLTAAAGSNTIANGDNPQVWNWALTTTNQSAFTFGETTAGTGPGELLVNIQTKATSTAAPLTITAGGTANGVQVGTTGALIKIGTGSVVADAAAASIALTTPVITTDIHSTSAGSATVGSAALPFGSVYIGTAATNNIKVTGTSAAARVVTIPDVAADSTVVLAATSTTTTQFLAASATAGLGAYRVIATTDLPAVSFTTPGSSKTFSAATPTAIFECTTTCTITMPVPAAGQQYCVRNANNVSTVITFAAIGSSAMYEATAKTSYGTAGTGTLVSGGSVLDQMCLVGKDSTHFDIYSYAGSWVAN